MKMKRRSWDDRKWYEPVRSRKWRREDSFKHDRQSRAPKLVVSRASTGSLMNSDRGNYSSSRSTSRASQLLDLSSSFKQGSRAIMASDIDDILNLSLAVERPRSVSLVKYDPLPAINSSTHSKSGSAGSVSQGSIDLELSHRSADHDLSHRSHDLHLTLQEKEEGHEDEEQKLLNQLKGLETDGDNLSPEGQATAIFEPPKLVRSRTFEVIETNLTNLPEIEETSSDQESEKEDTPRWHIIITVNGAPIQDFISQSQNLLLHNSRSSEHFGMESRPSSRSSLITHPGTPDSGFGGPSFDRSTGSRSNCRSSRSLAYQLQDPPDSEVEDDMDQTLEQGLYIRFPNDTLVFSSGALNETLGDFLKRIEDMSYEGRKLKIKDNNVPDVDLQRKLSHYGITEDVTIHLLPES